MTEEYDDVTLTVDGDMVATVEIHRPPNNFFDVPLIRALVAIYRAVDADPACRAIVLCSEGRHFCAGADFAGQSSAQPGGSGGQLYIEAVRLFEAATPVVAAVQGAAIGGGLGLACSADFRVAAPEARFSANFSRLGFHHGFGLSATLPRIVGGQHALDMLYTGRRVPGDEALAMGLCDRLVPLAELRPAAHAMAAEIARSAPLAVRAIRQTMRGELPELVRRATAHESEEQERLRQTEDFAEGVRATAERREPTFTGR